MNKKSRRPGGSSQDRRRQRRALKATVTAAVQDTAATLATTAVAPITFAVLAVPATEVTDQGSVIATFDVVPEFAVEPLTLEGPLDVARMQLADLLTPARTAAELTLDRARASLSVSGSANLALSDRDKAWDAAAAEARVRDWADATDGPNARYARAFLWRDDDQADDFAGYNLPFADVVDGSLVAVWRGVTAAAGAIQGARGGVDIPDDDVAGVKGRVEGYYAKARDAYGDDTIRAPWDADEAAGQSAAFLLALAEVDPDGLDLFTLAVTGGDGLEVVVGVGGSNEAATEFLARRAYWEAELRAPADVEDGMSNGEREAYERGRDETLQRMTALLANFEVDLAIPPAGETLPDRTPGPDAPEGPTRRDEQAGLRWTADFVPEGVLTDDGRCMAPGSMEWRDLPLSLMAMIETQPGHDGAQVAGRIDQMWRDGGMIRASGVFDGGDYGRDIARMVGDGTLRGISVDIAIHDYEVGPRGRFFDDDGDWRDEPLEMSEDPLDVLMGETVVDDPILVVTKGVIGASTVCPFPAFADASIALAASLVAGAWPSLLTCTMDAGWLVDMHRIELVAGAAPTPVAPALTASAAGIAPVEPPRDWFDDPLLDEPTPLTVTDDGRIYGHAWTWDFCHTAFPDVCTTAPHSLSGYRYYLCKEVVCDDGTRVVCGTVTMDAPHAGLGLGAVAATAHYDNTGLAVADVVVGEDEHGAWVAGALRPDVDAEKARALRGATLSGDWRGLGGAGEAPTLELIALLAVNAGGFPIPRLEAALAAGADGGMEVEALVAAGTLTPVVVAVGDGSALERIAALARRDRFAAIAERAR